MININLQEKFLEGSIVHKCLSGEEDRAGTTGQVKGNPVINNPVIQIGKEIGIPRKGSSVMDMESKNRVIMKRSVITNYAEHINQRSQY